MQSKLIIICLTVLGGLAAPAFADEAPGAVVVTASPLPQNATIAKQAASAVLATAGWLVREVNFSEREQKQLMTCLGEREAMPCLTPMLKRKGLQRVAVLSMNMAAATHELVITARLADAASNHIAMAQRYCELCTDDTLAASTTDLTKTLTEQLAVLSGRTVVEVRSTPEGALIFVDGVAMGATTKRIPVAPGPHLIRVELAGKPPVEKQVIGLEGQTASVVVDFESGVVEAQAGLAPRAPNKLQTRESNGPSKVGPALVIATGVTAIIAGGVMLAMHEPDPVRAADTEQPQYYTSTLLPGGLTLGAGIAATVAGVWWLRSSKRAPVVAPTQGGAVVGFWQRF